MLLVRGIPFVLSEQNIEKNETRSLVLERLSLFCVRVPSKHPIPNKNRENDVSTRHDTLSMKVRTQAGYHRHHGSVNRIDPKLLRDRAVRIKFLEAFRESHRCCVSVSVVVLGLDRLL